MCSPEEAAEKEEVCGTDSVTYPSICSLKRQACLTNSTTSLLHKVGDSWPLLIKTELCLKIIIIFPNIAYRSKVLSYIWKILCIE